MMNMRWVRDTVERTIATYLQVLIGLTIADASALVDLSRLRVAAVSAIPAGLAVVKAALASRLGGTLSPASVASS